MNFEEACSALRSLAERSVGRPIPTESGEYSFQVIGRFEASALRDFEREWQIELPATYRSFLVSVGSGLFYKDEFGLGLELRPLSEIAEYSERVFLGRRNRHPQLLLVGTLMGRGDEIGFDLTHSGPRNFSAFSAEEDPEEWGGIETTWTTFPDWLTTVVSSGGEDDLP